MSPDDPRHGTYAGAVQHWSDGESACEPCVRAGTKRRAWNRYLELVGKPATVPAIGVVRRAQALHTLGWTSHEIAAAAGIPYGTLRNAMDSRCTNVYRATHEGVAAAFDRLCMTFAPPSRNANYVRNQALRRGYPGPLAWDDIDRDEEPIGMRGTTGDEEDDALVERILGGEWELARGVGRSIRLAVIDEWPGSLNDLERLTGWNVYRDLRTAMRPEKEAS